MRGVGFSTPRGEAVNVNQFCRGREGGRVSSCHSCRTRKTIVPHIPTRPGRSTPGFHGLGRHCLHQGRSAARCLASCMNVAPCSEPLARRTFLYVYDSVERINFVSLVWRDPNIAMSILCNCLVGCRTTYLVHTTRYEQPFLCGVNGFNPAQNISLDHHQP